MDIADCAEQFVNMLKKLGAENNEIFRPLITEMIAQLKPGQKVDRKKIVDAAAIVRKTTGYHAKFGDALNFIEKNWGTPVTNVTSRPNMNMIAPIRSTTTTSSSGTINSAAKWQQMLNQQQFEKHRQEQSARQQQAKVIDELAKSTKPAQLEEAWKQLRLDDTCKKWFEYLRQTKTVPYAKNCATAEQAFLTAVKGAKERIDPLLKSRKIHNDARPIMEDLGGAIQSRSKESAIKVVLAEFGLTDDTNPTYWFAKGMILSINPDITIRCDGSAALAFYTLATDPNFNATIALVKQGDPKQSGHWFLIAGAAVDMKIENVNPLGTKPLKSSWIFTVDLWGAFFQKLTTTVFYPALCIAGNWKEIKLVWKL